jgi:hypothetical protein
MKKPLLPKYVILVTEVERQTAKLVTWPMYMYTLKETFKRFKDLKKQGKIVVMKKVAFEDYA